MNTMLVPKAPIHDGRFWWCCGIRVILCFGWCIGLLSGLLAQPPDWAGQKVNVVLIRVHRSNRTDETAAGIYVGSSQQSAYFVTAYHVLSKIPEDQESGLVESADLQFTNSPDIIGATVLQKFDPALDLGVIRIPVAALPANIPKLGMRPPSLELGIHIIGHPPAGTWSAWTGRIVNENAAFGDVHHFTTNTDQSLAAGYSGGAVYDSSGSFLGMHLGATNTYGKNLKAADIAMQLSGWNVPTNNLTSANIMDTAQAIHWAPAGQRSKTMISEDRHCDPGFLGLHSCEGEPTRKNFLITMDAGSDERFSNPQLSCIAGACAFTSNNLAKVQNDGKQAVGSFDVWGHPSTWQLTVNVEKQVANTDE